MKQSYNKGFSCIKFIIKRTHLGADCPPCKELSCYYVLCGKQQQKQFITTTQQQKQKQKQQHKNVSSHVRKKTTTTKHRNTYRKDNNRASAIETKQLRILKTIS